MTFSGFCHSGRPQSKNKRKKREKYLDFARELKKNPVEHGGDGGTNPQRLSKKCDGTSQLYCASDHWFVWRNAMFTAQSPKWCHKKQRKKVKFKIWRTRLAHWCMGVCHLGPYFNSVYFLPPLHLMWILPCEIQADHYSFRGTSRFWVHLSVYFLWLTHSNGFL